MKLIQLYPTTECIADMADYFFPIGLVVGASGQGPLDQWATLIPMMLENEENQ